MREEASFLWYGVCVCFVMKRERRKHCCCSMQSDECTVDPDSSHLTAAAASLTAYMQLCEMQQLVRSEQ